MKILMKKMIITDLQNIKTKSRTIMKPIKMKMKSLDLKSLN